VHLQVDAPAPNVPGATATIHNLSETGLLIETGASLSIGDTIEVELPRAGTRTAEVVWNGDGLFGCRFTEELTSGAVSAALLQGSFGAHSIGVARQDLTPGAEFGAENSARPQDKLSPRVRLGLKVGLALLAWAVVAGLVALVFGSLR